MPVLRMPMCSQGKGKPTPDRCFYFSTRRELFSPARPDHNILVMLGTDHIEAEIDAANAPHDEKEGENGEISLRASQKSTRSRYMSPTVSAKAKARTSPKTRVEGEESPAKQQKRLSFGSPSVGRPKSPNLNAAARSKSISQVSHCLRVFQSAFAFLNTV